MPSLYCRDIFRELFLISKTESDHDSSQVVDREADLEESLVEGGRESKGDEREHGKREITEGKARQESISSASLMPGIEPALMRHPPAQHCR